MWAPMRSLPKQNCKNWTPFCSGEKIFNFSTRDPDHLHALESRAYGAIFSKNSFFGTTHGDKPTSQNGISLRSPSLIMAPGQTKCALRRDGLILVSISQTELGHSLKMTRRETYFKFKRKIKGKNQQPNNVSLEPESFGSFLLSITTTLTRTYCRGL